MRWLLFIFTLLVIAALYFWITKIEEIVSIPQKDWEIQVFVTVFTNPSCQKCTKVSDYLKVYEKAGV